MSCVRTFKVPPWKQYSSFMTLSYVSQPSSLSVLKLQQLLPQQHIGPCGITHAAAMKTPPSSLASLRSSII